MVACWWENLGVKPKHTKHNPTSAFVCFNNHLRRLCVAEERPTRKIPPIKIPSYNMQDVLLLLSRVWQSSVCSNCRVGWRGVKLGGVGWRWRWARGSNGLWKVLVGLQGAIRSGGHHDLRSQSVSLSFLLLSTLPGVTCFLSHRLFFIYIDFSILATPTSSQKACLIFLCLLDCWEVDQGWYSWGKEWHTAHRNDSSHFPHSSLWLPLSSSSSPALVLPCVHKRQGSI